MQTLAEYINSMSRAGKSITNILEGINNIAVKSEWAINFKESRMLISNWTQMNNLVLSGHSNCCS